MEKYFLSQDGVRTKRIAGPPGRGHIDIARELLGEHDFSPTEADEVYQQMFLHGYARVAETEDTVQVEYLKRLSNRQRAFLDEKRRAGKRIVVNCESFIATKGSSEPAE